MRLLLRHRALSNLAAKPWFAGARPVADADAPYPLGDRLLEVSGLEVGVLVGGGHEEDGPQDHQQVCA